MLNSLDPDQAKYCWAWSGSNLFAKELRTTLPKTISAEVNYSSAQIHKTTRRAIYLFYTVLDLDLISIASLGPRASTKVESHVNFTESQKVYQPIFFFAILYTEKFAKTIN